MAMVSFDRICRACLTSNGVRSNYMVNGDLQKLRSYTEFEMSKKLEKWLRDDNKKCDFCEFPFLDAASIEIDGYKLYDPSKLVKACQESNGELFIWGARKQGHTIELKVGGKPTHDPIFLKECFAQLFEMVDNFQEYKLIHNPEVGDIFICFTGDYKYETQSFEPIVQRFSCTGLSREEVIRSINAQLVKFQMHEIVRPI